jgi:hypothetical protein
MYVCVCVNVCMCVCVCVCVRTVEVLRGRVHRQGRAVSTVGTDRRAVRAGSEGGAL